MRKSKHDKLSHEAIVRALLENYESIYAVDADTSNYQCYHESDLYSTLCLDNRGNDFFDDLKRNILNTIYVEDQKFVMEKLYRKMLIESLKKEKFYSFVYRLMIDGQPLYHKLRATKDTIDGRPYFLIGIRNVDASFRQDKALAEKMATMHSKEANYLEAILAGAEGYIEANITKDTVLELSQYRVNEKIPDSFRDSVKQGTLAYSTFMKWHTEHMTAVNKERFIRISDREYLINCFEHNEKRASVSFSLKTPDGDNQPCKMVFYLYQDEASCDVLSFCVLYDLTEQQRKEKELQDLENELQMIRLRNFTSQMQPHFLYNALGSIQEVVLTDPQYASELIGDFTTHLRSCIRAMSNDSPIPFRQELANIKAYANIEKMRFGDKLDVRYDIREKDFMILPLSVQPLVENAIRHGIYERGEQGGQVEIKTETAEGSVRIKVKDNGIGFDVEKYFRNISEGDHDSTGLKNVMFRLDKIMHAKVSINSIMGSGTEVTITLPKGGSNESDHS